MGERIRNARRVLRIRTGELVSRWGLTPAMISFTERGINGPSYRFLYALERYSVSPKRPAGAGMERRRQRRDEVATLSPRWKDYRRPKTLELPTIKRFGAFGNPKEPEK